MIVGLNGRSLSIMCVSRSQGEVTLYIVLVGLKGRSLSIVCVSGSQGEVTLYSV